MGGCPVHPQMVAYRCTIMRGGTSKGVFFKRNELPGDPVLRDRVILAVFGSPDVRQIDGLGGADALTSKVAVIGPPTRPGADVDYTFGQVSITEAAVDYRANCGNISAAVGPYAIDEGFVEPVEPVTKVRIHQTNTRTVIVAEVPVVGGKAAVEGDARIDGCPGTGAPIRLDFSDSAGAVTGKLLPTGNTRDTVEVNGRRFTISIVDAGNPLVFVHAGELGLRGIETPREIEGDPDLLRLIDEIRSAAAEMIGLVADRREARSRSPHLPFFAICSPPAEYRAFDTGRTVAKDDVDIVCRLLFTQKVHKTYPGTGAVCTGAAAKIPGTVPNEVLEEAGRRGDLVRIGHPAGVVEVEAAVTAVEGGFRLERAGFIRTARRIMDGIVYVRRSVLQNALGSSG